MLKSMTDFPCLPPGTSSKSSALDACPPEVRNALLELARIVVDTWLWEQASQKSKAAVSWEYPALDSRPGCDQPKPS